MSSEQKEEKEDKPDYILLCIKGKIYAMNKEDIPEEGMLRSLYDMKGGEKIIKVDLEVDPDVVDFFFYHYKKSKICNENIVKIMVSRKEYIDLIKMCRYFQVDEKVMKNKIEIYWIWKYMFISESDFQFNGKTQNEAVIFSTIYDDNALLSIRLGNEKCYVADFCITNSREQNKKNSNSAVYCDYLPNKQLKIIKFSETYKLYVDNIFLVNLLPKNHNIIYDPIANNFVVQ